jgi:hypothetical protein
MKKISKQEAKDQFGIDLDRGVYERDGVRFHKRDDIEEDDQPTPQPLLEKLGQFITVLSAADPTRSPQEHLYRLLHTPRGAALATRLNSLHSSVPPTHHLKLSKNQKDTPMVDIFKLSNPQSVVEIAKAINSGEATNIPFSEVLMGHARLSKRAGESDAKAFTRLYESDIEFRKADKAATEAGWIDYQKSSYPNMMSVEVVSVETGDTNVSSDSWKAADQLKALVEEQRARAPTLSTEQLYDAVMRNPANRATVDRAFRRPNASSVNTDYLER